MSEPTSNEDVRRLAELIRQSMLDTITSQAEPALALPWARNSNLKLSAVIIGSLFGIVVLAVLEIAVIPYVVILVATILMAT